jgi:SAM-dependent methyltransferase
MSASRLAPNWAFVLYTATSLAPSGRILDYGCGQGEVVAAGVERGLDIYGAEVFYGGAHGQREALARRGLLERRVFHITKGQTPFEDSTFDFVFHNQVFEHVPDLDEALQEIRRVLKPGGMMLSLFPSQDILPEGHCGVPLAHRFRKGSRLRYLWLLGARRCGLGRFHGDKSPEQWARDFARWLEDWCYYRSRKDIVHAYRRSGFSFDSYETAYAAFRLEYIGWKWAVRGSAILAPMTRWAIRKLAGMVVLSRVTKRSKRE